MNMTDGKAVAKLLVDEYLNNFRSEHREFMNMMAGQQPEIRENCTYLGYAWLKGLSEVVYYDLRNEQSKLLADDICMHISQEPKLNHIPYSGSAEIEVDAQDDEQVVYLFTGYLMVDSGNGYHRFVDYALSTHRTLQQNLTRFFVEWFRKTEESSQFLEIAGQIYPRYHLSYI